MKFVLAALALCLAVPALASWTPPPPGVGMWDQDRTNPNPIDRWPDRDIPGHQPVGGGGGFTVLTCAPEVVEGNVAATERTLSGLVRSPDFASASRFRAQVAAVGALKSPSLKVVRYFSLIGVDASRSADVADFVGARSIDARWTTSLQRNSGLSAAQADIVAARLQTALRGSLQ